MRFLLACLIKIVNLSYEVHHFWPCLFWFLSGGVRGPMSIAHVFVISVPRSFDGLPRCDKTTSSKSWPSSRVAPIRLLVALAVRGFFNCSNAVLAFSALGLGPRFQSLFGWSWPRKEHVKIYAHLPMDNSNMASKIRR